MGKEATKSFEKDPGVYRRWSVARRTELSLADIAATPYRVRLEMLKLPPMWDKKPGVGEWWEESKHGAHA